MIRDPRVLSEPAGTTRHMPEPLLTDLPEATGLPPRYSSAINELDSVSGGGVEGGSLWAVVGARGQGVTELALTICAAAAVHDGRKVTYLNSHLPPRALRQRAAAVVRGGNSQRSAVDNAPATVDAAPLQFVRGLHATDPDDAIHRLHDLLHDTEVLAVDTLDEALCGELPASLLGNDLICHLRGLRAAIRDSRTSIIVTARVAPRGVTAADVNNAWRRHPLHESVMDAADVVVTLSDTTWNVLRADVDVRGHVPRTAEIPRRGVRAVLSTFPVRPR